MASAARLSKRLQAIADMVPQGAYLADIGSDHAFLPIYLVQKGKISYAQAVDNKPGPFLHMQGNIEDAGLSSFIQASLSNGLDELSAHADTLALCGLGGILTCDILEKHPQKLEHIQTIICDPHRDLVSVRKKVTALGYYISNEAVVYENKIFYFIIRFDKGEPFAPYTEDDYYFGPVARSRRSKEFLAWIEETLKTVNNQLSKNLPKQRRDYYSGLARKLEAQLKGNADK